MIPGHSIVIQQDYIYTDWNGWLHVTMEYLSDYFEIVDLTEINSVAFLYKKQIPKDILQIEIFQNLDAKEIIRLQKKAISRFQGNQKKIMKKSREHLLWYLKKRSWPGHERIKWWHTF